MLNCHNPVPKSANIPLIPGLVVVILLTVISEDRLRELLTTIGDRLVQLRREYDQPEYLNSRFTDDEVDEMYREAPIKNGMFDYAEFTRILKHGAKEKDEV